ncbi:AUGMIN subunit 4 [Dioscorea cayenensis subsp. rotundata]|uniref:AUGMIN subunit 4 n=1 Tax=Dioscorea cayennensis subsp. rotundata TaxID=55577 RepID=A0AB40C5M7_DIOCR|nr:AUGMIN subunit 4 [Dioscorea cayenensis subsp. rotundata]
MAKVLQGQSLPADVVQLIEQLERHCLAADGSLVSKSSHSDLQLAREEMSRERTRYLEAMAVYCEALAMVEEYQQSMSSANLGSGRDYSQQGLKCSSQVYEALEHRLVVAEAAQRLRLPLISKDGEIHEEEIEKWSTMSSSLDSSITLSSSSNSTSYVNSNASMLSGAPSANNSDVVELGVGGVPNCFLGITSSYLWQVQQQQPALDVDMIEYQRSVVREIESRLEAKCDTLADVFAMDEIDSSSISHISTARLPERVKLIIEEIEREEAVLLEDLNSMDRKFAEHYNVLEQILGVLIKFVKDLKLQHQHEFDKLRKTWLCKRCQTMNAKLRVLEHLLLRDTYTKDSVPALHRIRKYLVEATEEASIAYNKAVTRLREYHGVDPHFDTIARQYHDIVKKLEGMQWTIHQVEMDLKRSLNHSVS